MVLNLGCYHGSNAPLAMGKIWQGQCESLFRWPSISSLNCHLRTIRLALPGIPSLGMKKPRSDFSVGAFLIGER